MVKRLLASGSGMCAIAGLLLLPLAGAAGSKKAAPGAPPPVRATVQPTLTIPATPLGFAAPGEFYLGSRNSLVSLDFLDENRVLFTFRVPGLLHREVNGDGPEGQRQIRALVLRLPTGAVESETVWTVHDRARYVYMLDGGQFLVRDGNELKLGDATLELKPFLRFPGPVEALEIDPSRKYLVTNSEEPAVTKAKPGEVGSPATAQAMVTTDETDARDAKEMVVRILRRKSGEVMLVSRVRTAVHLPINDEGYLETLRGQGMAWTVNFNHFSGGSTILGRVDSVCSPDLSFLSEREFLATACDRGGEPWLVAMGMNGKQLWHQSAGGPAVWPLLVVSANGTRLAREVLMASHAVSTMAPLGTDDIRGQDVQVMDAATGKTVLRAAASPVFDAGGNVAISPSGRRVAILMEGNLQVFDLPEPAALPAQ